MAALLPGAGTPRGLQAGGVAGAPEPQVTDGRRGCTGERCQAQGREASVPDGPQRSARRLPTALSGQHTGPAPGEAASLAARPASPRARRPRTGVGSEDDCGVLPTGPQGCHFQAVGTPGLQALELDAGRIGEGLQLRPFRGAQGAERSEADEAGPARPRGCPVQRQAPGLPLAADIHGQRWAWGIGSMSESQHPFCPRPGPRGVWSGEAACALSCPPRTPTSTGSVWVPCPAVLLWREGRGGGWAEASEGHPRERGRPLTDKGASGTPQAARPAGEVGSGGWFAPRRPARRRGGDPGEWAPRPARARRPPHLGQEAPEPEQGSAQDWGPHPRGTCEGLPGGSGGEPDPGGRRARAGHLPPRARGGLGAPDPAAHPSSLGL